MTASIPPSAPQNFSMQPRSNGPALASLICALVGFCVPVVGGLLGIVLGFVGLKRARETASGAGMATAGIIIGIITILGWAGTGYGIYKVGQATARAFEAPRAAARQYVMDLNKGDLIAAATDSSGITKDELVAQSAILQPMGAFQDMTSSNLNMVNSNCTLIGVGTFAKGPKTYTIKLAAYGPTWKVIEATFQ